MENPFVYGEIVPVGAFADRLDELDRLVRDLESGQKVFLISPRRFGKSSLIAQALATLRRRGALAAEVTVASHSSYVAFLEGYTRALVALETSWERARVWLRDAFRSTRPEVRLEPGAAGVGRMAVSFPGVHAERDVNRLAAEVFELPGRIASARKRRVVVALDEFQAVTAFDGGRIEQMLREAVQRQRQVGYVFAGSEPTLMERMVGPRRPFYKAGPVMRLDRIPPDAFAAFIESRFAKSGIRPEAGLGAAMVDLGGNLPYDVQRLAHETWDDLRAAGRKRATIEDLHTTLRRLLLEHEPVLEARWQRLTLAQRATLRAVVLGEGRELLSAGARVRYRLGGPSSVQHSLGALVRDDIVMREGSRFVAIDSLLREWVARRTS